MKERIATYRLQFRPGFGFKQATELIPYLKELGISHLYASPYLQAAAGSLHGYDIVDPTRINKELGSHSDHTYLCKTLTDHNLGQMIDIVPNHMALDGKENTWWWDVLKNGSSSTYANYFDIDWKAGKILLPTLEDHPEKLIENGLITLSEENSEQIIRYRDQCFPLSPDSMPEKSLKVLLNKQHYKLAFWKTASKELNYRRFFDIISLIGLRIEDEKVFKNVHILPLSWVKKGWVDGLRVDHPDGLRDPSGYFTRLRKECPNTWIVAEKILEPSEQIPSEWPIEGTTGYDFLNLSGGLFVDPAGELPLTRFYGEFTGEEIDYKKVVHTCKRKVLHDLFESELNRLSTLFLPFCDNKTTSREILSETIVSFPVYRSYIVDKVSDQDKHVISTAIKEASHRRPDLDPKLFNLFKQILLLQTNEKELPMQFQQLTGPVMAKGVEDTAFYRYNRLIALNEVGGDPGIFGTTVKHFHDECANANAYSLLATTTHDTKRSEDVRARLALLSEIPQKWEEIVREWAVHNEQHRPPDRNTEYLLYQTLIGAWPIDVERVKAYMEKAIREAKMHTSWTDQNITYEQEVLRFVEAIMKDKIFLKSLEMFTEKLIAPGQINSLSQTLLKLTAPGIPDIYQGTELWDLSLVDPDNRRAVDFNLRKEYLKQKESHPKLWLIRQALNFRKRRPELFGPEGSYKPVDAGCHVAFMRGEEALTVAPRITMRKLNPEVSLPEGKWRNLLTGESVEGKIILDRFPVALMERIT